MLKRALVSVEGVEIDTFKLLDFEGFGELFVNFRGTAGLRDGKPVPYNVVCIVFGMKGYENNELYSKR